MFSYIYIIFLLDVRYIKLTSWLHIYGTVFSWQKITKFNQYSTKFKRKEELALERGLISREEDLGTFQTRTPITLSIPSNTIDLIHSLVYFMTNLLHSQFSPVCLQLVSWHTALLVNIFWNLLSVSCNISCIATKISVFKHFP